MKALRWTSILLALACAIPAGVAAQGATATLTGRVLDSESRQPVAGAVVQVGGPAHKAETDSSGTFRISGLVPGLASVSLIRIGYAPVSRNINLVSQRPTAVEYVMTREGTRLPEVAVTGRPEEVEGSAIMAGFEERRRMGGGVFLDAAQLARYQSRRMADVLRGASGVRLLVDGQSAFVASNRQQVRSIITGPNLPCYLDIIVDGELYWSMTRSQNRESRAPNINAIVSVGDLGGVEIYNSTAAIPPKYRSIGNACGAVMLWTKRGLELKDPPDA